MDDCAQIAADFLVFHPGERTVRIVKAEQEDYFFLVSITPGCRNLAPEVLCHDIYEPAWRAWVEAGRPTVKHGIRMVRMPEHLEGWISPGMIIDNPSLCLLLRTFMQDGLLSAVDILGCVGDSCDG